MRHPRGLFALALSGLACAALAPGALAREGGPTHQFTGTITKEVSAQGVGQQEFDFNQLNIKCNRAKPLKGAPKTTFPALKFVALVQFGKCKTAPLKIGGETLRAAKAVFNDALEIEYHAGGEPNAEIKNASAVEITIPELECTVSWAPSVSLSELALYRDVEVKAKSTKRFPLGVQDMVLIENLFEKISWSASGGACNRLKTTASKIGEYVGTLRAELKSGNLGWE
jgi:hypothetical protein